MTLGVIKFLENDARPLAYSFSVCHNSGIVNTGISGSSLWFFFWGEGGGVGSDYMCTGHAV